MHRNISIDILKFFLAFFVVGLHFGFLSDQNVFYSFFFNQGIFRAAVPIFLIISGYYFQRIYDKQSYFDWFKRLLIMYLFWTLVYMFFWIKLDIPHIILSLVYGYFHLWYIIGILLASIFVFKIRTFDSKLIILIIIFSYSTGCIIQYLSSYGVISLFDKFKVNQATKVPVFIYRNFLFDCLPFLLTGLLIRRHENIFSKKKQLNLILLLSFIVLCVEICFNFYYSTEKSFDMLFSLLVFCPLLFIWVKQIDLCGNANLLGLISSAIFFIHPLIYFLFIHNLGLGATLKVLLTFLLSFFASFPIIWLNRRLKIL